MTQVTLHDFTFKYSKADTPALNNINLTFDSAKFNLLVGPSGSGKTTLLKFIAGLYPQFIDTPASGRIEFDGQEISSMPPLVKNRQVAMVFQNPNQQFAMDTVANELNFVLENLQTPPEQMDAIITQALTFCDVLPLRTRVLNTLSGGEKQRVALACIVAMNPAVIVLDEPFASIDPQTRQDLIAKLKVLQTEHHKTIILADHDLTDYANTVDQVFELDPDDHQITTLTKSQADQMFVQFQRSVPPETPVSLPSDELNAVIELTDFSLGPHAKELLAPLHFNFYRGQTTLITGDNGIGKSTLFAALTKLTSYRGTVNYDGHNITKIKARHYALEVSLLFQDAEDQFLAITVAEELELARKHRQNQHYSDQQIEALLLALDLADKKHQVIYSLSEGQKKKLQIAVMLIMASPVLLLDEPLKGLDLESVKVVVRLLQEAKELFHQTQIIISHQLTGLAPLVDLHVLFADHQLAYREVLG